MLTQTLPHVNNYDQGEQQTDCPNSPLDAVLAATEANLFGAAPTPQGYKLLPAGTTRQVRANKAWSKKPSVSNKAKPIALTEDGGATWTEYSDVVFLGTSRMVAYIRTKSCGTYARFGMETTGDVLVKS
jgi:hypothetical protein